MAKDHTPVGAIPEAEAKLLRHSVVALLDCLLLNERGLRNKYGGQFQGVEEFTIMQCQQAQTTLNLTAYLE